MRLFLLSIASLLSVSAFSQYELSSFCNTGHGGATTFATDYQATSINPANLGWDYRYTKKKFTMGFAEFTGSVYSQALSKTELRGMVNDLITNKGQNFTIQQKRDAAKDFTLTGFTMNANLGSFGAAFLTKKLGGFGFRINDSYQAYLKLGNTAADLLFLGKTSSVFDSLTIVNSLGVSTNIANYQNMSPDSVKMVVNGYTNAPKLMSKILNGSEITMTWTREYNLSYGKKIFGDSTFAMFGGIGVKYFQGLALINVKSENDQLTGYSSLTPAFNVDYGTAANAANQIKQSGGLPKSVGSGMGFDLGLNIIIKNRLKIGASYINAGSIKWKGNLYSVKDTFVYSTTNAGLNNYNPFSQLGDIFGKNGLLKLEGEQERTIKLPGVFRTGASLILGKNKIAEIGIDCIFPLSDVPGKLNKPLIGFGGDIYIAKVIKLQAGFITGGNYKYSVPLGIIFIAKDGTWEAGLASRDAVTFFTQNGPTLSLSTGFMRFRF